MSDDRPTTPVPPPPFEDEEINRELAEMFPGDPVARLSPHDIHMESLIQDALRLGHENNRVLGNISTWSSESVANSRRAASDSQHSRQSAERTERRVAYMAADIKTIEGRMSNIEQKLDAGYLLILDAHKDLKTLKDDIRNELAGGVEAMRLEMEKAIAELWKRADVAQRQAPSQDGAIREPGRVQPIRPGATE